jgi:hypothetical protein
MPRLSKIGAAALAAFGWTSGGVSAVTATTLVVAGGGGGSGGAGSGGSGGGGLLYGTMSLNPTLSYTIVVGAGGVAAASSGVVGGLGGNSVFNNATAVGGGVASTGGALGLDGGSGGGGGGATVNGSNRSATNATQGNSGGLTGYGNNGSNTYGSSDYAGGGGGGAGAAGGASTSNNGGNGGVGLAYSISGTSTYYAGGGAGGGTGSGGTGGLGGGGNGGNTSINGTNGTSNTGGGAGGQRLSNPGANGGSGVVIISYAGAQQFGGGVVTSSGGNTIHTFNTSGTLSPISSLSASYLIVAGGGGGGNSFGGGGGAGGLLSGSGTTIDTNSTYLVTVGAGGAAASSNTINGLQGANSSWSMVSTVAVGGGGGVSGYSQNYTGKNGGSGGGGSGNDSYAYTIGGTGTSGQGFAGGNGNQTNRLPSGGGGGAGAAGGTATSTVAGSGGIGVSSSISGTATYYAGGGGGDGGLSGGTAGTGGLGGGGNGALLSGAATSGTANTGGGGGGAGTPGNGGSGIVIISYAGSTQLMAGGTVTIVGGNVIHTFTSSGYLSPLTYVGNSLRFRASASAYLSRTPTITSNQKTFTWSGWIKRGTLGSSSQQDIFRCQISGDGNNLFQIYWYNDNIFVRDYQSGYTLQFITTAVYRDPAAWYHIVVAIDTTQATSTNRFKLYVNGTQVTAFSTADYPAQNTNTVVDKSGTTNWIGFGNYFDGYMANINFIDGQALTPNSFGTFNSYGVWQPIYYGGSYGTNGFYLPFNTGSSTYSGLFNGSSQYLSVADNSAFNIASNDFTVECWFNSSSFGTGQFVLSQWNSASYGYAFSINNSTTIKFEFFSGGTYYNRSYTVPTLSTGVWYNIAWVRSSGTTTLYLNGIATGTPTSDNYSITDSNQPLLIGINGDGNNQYFNGYISNLRFVNGTAVYTSNFTPSTSNLTAVTNTKLLTLQNATIVDNSTNAFSITNTNGVTTGQTYPFAISIFKDQGPAGNNWTPNNISGAFGSTLDYMTDVPTLTSATAANYAVLNPLYPNGSASIINGNLTVSPSGTYCNGLSTIQLNSGAYYAECTVTTAQAMGWGIWLNSASTTASVGTTPTGFYGIYSGGATLMLNGTSPYTNAAGTPSNGDIVQVAWNNGNVWFGKNNVWYNSTFGTTGNPATGANPTVSGLSANAFSIAFCGANASPVLNANFGQQPFVYTPPSGFVALNTYNL